MDNLIKTYRRCHGEPARRGPDGRLAVIRYPPGERACAPWFFARLGTAWANSSPSRRSSRARGDERLQAIWFLMKYLALKFPTTH